MSKIAVDIDSTLYDFYSLASRITGKLAEQRGDGRLRNAAYSTWDEWRTPIDLAGLEAWQEIVDICHRPENIIVQPPFPGASDALWELKRAGHELIYVSNRNAATYEPTFDWLMAKDFPIDKVRCHQEDKLRSIRDCQYLIDDRPKTLVGFVHGGGPALVRKAFALLMPYNRGLTDVPNIYLAPNWPLLATYLREKIPSEAKV